MSLESVRCDACIHTEECQRNKTKERCTAYAATPRCYSCAIKKNCSRRKPCINFKEQSEYKTFNSGLADDVSVNACVASRCTKREISADCEEASCVIGRSRAIINAGRTAIQKMEGPEGIVAHIRVTAQDAGTARMGEPTESDLQNHAQFLIREICNELADTLVKKNEAYGNSFADPVRCFSKAPVLEQINVRLDDKLSRFMRGHEYPGDDTELDLIGYLILKRVAKRLLGEGEEDAK